MKHTLRTAALVILLGWGPLLLMGADFHGVLWPSTTVDNALFRADGTAGAAQVAQMTEDDSGNVTTIGTMNIAGINFSGIAGIDGWTSTAPGQATVDDGAGAIPHLIGPSDQPLVTEAGASQDHRFQDASADDFVFIDHSIAGVPRISSGPGTSAEMRIAGGTNHDGPVAVESELHVGGTASGGAKNFIGENTVVSLFGLWTHQTGVIGFLAGATADPGDTPFVYMQRGGTYDSMDVIDGTFIYRRPLRQRTSDATLLGSLGSGVINHNSGAGSTPVTLTSAAVENGNTHGFHQVDAGTMEFKPVAGSQISWNGLALGDGVGLETVEPGSAFTVTCQGTLWMVTDAVGRLEPASGPTGQGSWITITMVDRPNEGASPSITLGTPLALGGTQQIADQSPGLEWSLETSGAGGTLTYLGSETLVFNVSMCISLTTPATNESIFVMIAKNGAEVDHTRGERFIATGAGDDVARMSVCGFIEMSTGDTLEPFGDVDGDTITADWLTLKVRFLGRP